MRKVKGKKKRPVAHQRAIQLLKEDPVTHLRTLCTMYVPGTVVPAKDIPALIKAFKEAGTKLGILKPTVKVIKALQKQLTEVKKEKEEEEKEES